MKNRKLSCQSKMYPLFMNKYLFCITFICFESFPLLTCRILLYILWKMRKLINIYQSRMQEMSYLFTLSHRNIIYLFPVSCLRRGLMIRRSNLDYSRNILNFNDNLFNYNSKLIFPYQIESSLCFQMRLHNFRIKRN